MAQNGLTRRTFEAGLLGASLAAATSSRAWGKSMERPPTKHVVINAKPASFALDLDRAALIVIDMQNDFGAVGGMFQRAGVDIDPIHQVVPAVAQTLATARDIGIPVIFLKMGFAPDLSDGGPSTGPNLVKQKRFHIGTEVLAPDGRTSRILIRDTWNTEILPELAPRPSEIQMYKTRYSGFYNTLLDNVLRERGITKLIITGCTTSVCVESTVRDAMFLDYDCLLLEDCMAQPKFGTETYSSHEATLLVMQRAFAWVSDSASFMSAIAKA